MKIYVDEMPTAKEQCPYAMEGSSTIYCQHMMTVKHLSYTTCNLGSIPNECHGLIAELRSKDERSRR